MEPNLPPPKKAIAEVLYNLITQPEIKEQNFRLNSFRSILSDLRNDYKLAVAHKDKPGKTKYGKQTVFRVHYLFKISIPRAKRLYEKINN